MKAETQETGVLAAILADTAASLAGRDGELAAWQRRAARAAAPPAFAAALRGADVGVIAEVKRRSPSAGALRAGADAVRLAQRYVEGGASGLSVLTEPTRFGGTLDDLERVARATGLPTLRKDFIIAPLQVYEARAAGASAVLLIVRALGAERLVALAALAHEIGLETLVEVHAADELAVAVAASPDAIGINARDLQTLAMDPARVTDLLPRVPAGVPAVAESGLRLREDVERVAAAGADAVLVGAALAGADDPAAVLAPLTRVARRGRGA